jgi:archaellum biogenesis ATPase FlaH
MALVSTGHDVLDRQIGGGIPSGSLVVLDVDPMSQAELLLQAFSGVRDTVYVTSQRSKAAVRDGYKRTNPNYRVPQLLEIDGEDPIDSASEIIKTVPEDTTLIIDTINVLEDDDPVRYRRFMNQLQTHMINTGGVAVLYALSGEFVPQNRDTTHGMADVIFRLETTVSGSDMVNTLSVPKYRGGRALDETIKLKLMERVSIDTSRDIA